MLSESGLKDAILQAMESKGFKREEIVQGQSMDTGLDKFAEAIASGIMKYILQNAEIVIPPGTVLIAAQAGIPNAVEIKCILR